MTFRGRFTRRNGPRSAGGNLAADSSWGRLPCCQRAIAGGPGVKLENGFVPNRVASQSRRLVVRDRRKLRLSGCRGAGQHSWIDVPGARPPNRRETPINFAANSHIT